MAKKKGRKGAISSSIGKLVTLAELEHLDGLSELHRMDVESNWRLLHGAEADAEREHAAMLESYYMGSGRHPHLVCNLWFGDAPGSCGAGVVMPGSDWKEELRKADDARRNWRDGKRMRTAKEGDLSGNLTKIFARLPPWIASAAGEHMSREDVAKAVSKLARQLEKETGLKVLAAAVHRETDHDLHVHFVVSKIGPVKLPGKKYSPDYVKKLVSDQRAEIREERNKQGEDSRLKAVKAEQERRWKTREMEDPRATGNRIEYQKIDRSTAPRRGLKSMGQQHCSKTVLWEASGRDPTVAAVREGHSVVSFRSTVQDAAAIAPEGDPAHKYVDYWLAKRWAEAVEERLPEEVRDRLPEAGRQAARRYVEDGSSLPNPILDAARQRADEMISAATDAASGIEKVAVIKASGILAEAEAQAAQKIRQAALLMADAARREEDMMTPPGVLETAGKVGFKPHADDGLRVDLEGIPHRLAPHAEGGFSLSRWLHSLGGPAWKTESKPILNGIGLIGKLWPKLDGMAVLEKLAGFFPNRIPGIVVGLGLMRNPETWRALLPQKLSSVMDPDRAAPKDNERPV